MNKSVKIIVLAGFSAVWPVGISERTGKGRRI